MNSEKLIQLIYDDLQVLKGQQEITNSRLDGMDKRLDSLEEKVLENTEGIKEVKEKVLENAEEIKEVKEKVLENAEEIKEVKEKVLENTEEIKEVKEKVLENTEEIRSINLCLENEIRPSIMRIAEGHLDLSRKLDEALKIDQEKEKLAIRMNFLEGKVERLDKKVSGLLQA